MNIIVTGSEGFIGKRLTSKLLQLNHNVVTIDRKIGSDAKDIVHMLDNIDAVIHLAAQTSVFNTNTEQICEDNITTFIKIANACNDKHVKLVYASSSTANNCNTTSLYGLSKRFDEEYASIYCPSATGVRLHNVWSENPREGTLMWCLLNKENTVLFNQGLNTRCFTYIDDAVSGLINAINSKEKLLNMVNYEPMKVYEFASIVKKYVPTVNFTISTEIRDKDNEVQLVNNDIPFCNVKCKHVEKWLQIIYKAGN